MNGRTAKRLRRLARSAYRSNLFKDGKLSERQIYRMLKRNYTRNEML